MKRTEAQEVFRRTRITSAVLTEVAVERIRQTKLWGEQNHSAWGWAPILGEEVGEVSKAMNENDSPNYREELIQVAAVAVAMVESYDRHGAAGDGSEEH